MALADILVHHLILLSSGEGLTNEAKREITEEVEALEKRIERIESRLNALDRRTLGSMVLD